MICTYGGIEKISLCSQALFEEKILPKGNDYMFAVMKLSYIISKIIKKPDPEILQDIQEVYDEFYLKAMEDLERRKKERQERAMVLWKRRKYFNYFKVRKRYGITFEEFNRRVDAGEWVAWMADEWYPIHIHSLKNE